MSISNYFDQRLLELNELNEIVPFKEKIDLEEDCVKFSGNPRRHPYDQSKLILIPDPQSQKKLFLEFLFNDIAHIEENTSLSSQNGVSLTQITIWVKKGCWGVKTEGFKV